ncbi:aminopeptidase [Chloroflexota bacterium]
MDLESIKLSRTAKMVVEVAAHVEPGENACIVTDTNKLSIAEALVKASYAVGAETVICIMTPRQKHNEEPPSVVAAAMKAAQVLIMPTTYAISHTEATQAALKSGARIMILREITEETFTNGAITADYEEVHLLTNRVADRLEPVSEVHMTTALGSNIRMSKKGQFVLRAGGLLRGELRATGLPTGEAAFSPIEGTANGVIVVDHSIDNIGLLSEPVKITVEKGCITKIEGGKEAKRLQEYVGNNKNGDNVAELAIGTNPRSRMLGNVAEDKILLGCVHIGIGSNLLLGGNVVSPLHFDLVILKPTVSFDGEEVVREGELLI